jgi:hypothetical protein
MSGLEIGVIVLATAWLAVLTLVVLLLVRQIGLLTVRLDMAAGERTSMDDDGLAVGTQVSARTVAALPELNSGEKYLLLFAASCDPCLDVADEVGRLELDGDVVALVAGKEELADDIAARLDGVRIVRDPEATELAGELAVSSVPFAFAISETVVAAKKYLHSARDLEELMRARADSAGALENGGTSR